MNELKESNEALKQTTDDLKKQQDEFKALLDLLNTEKENWVRSLINHSTDLIFISGE